MRAPRGRGNGRSGGAAIVGRRALSEHRPGMFIRAALLACLALVFGACSTYATATATRAPAEIDAGFADVVEEIILDPLDDPMTRVQCPPGLGDPCGPGRHCIAVGPGVLGLCVRDGSRGGLCRDAVIACDEEISCVEQWCAQNQHFGPRTRCGARQCGLNEGCVELDGRLQCVAHGRAGAYCRQGGERACDPGLTCDNVGDNRSRCGGPLGPGDTCVLSGRSTSFCAGDTVCVGDTLGGARFGTCQPLGSLGARCRAGNLCDAGLECQLPIASAQLTCLRAVPAGQACDAVTPGSARCTAGTSCIGGLCLPDGGRLGMCRSGDVPGVPRCDAGLICHRQWVTCVPPLATGAVCTVGDRERDCVPDTSCELSPGGRRVCFPDGVLGGRCRTPTMERPFFCEAGLECVARGRTGSYCEER